MISTENKQKQKNALDPFSRLTPSRRSVLIGTIIFALFGILTVTIYSNTLESPFVFDDKVRIEKNTHIRMAEFSLTKLINAGFNKSTSRPIPFMSFALNYYFHQYDLLGYHVVNIIVHLLSGYLLYLFISTTLKLPVVRPQCDQPELVAFLAALIWLASPVQIQSVTYIVQRLNSMAALFFILSFWLYVKGRRVQSGQNRWPWYLGSAIAWLLYQRSGLAVESESTVPVPGRRHAAGSRASEPCAGIAICSLCCIRAMPSTTSVLCSMTCENTGLLTAISW